MLGSLLELYQLVNSSIIPGVSYGSAPLNKTFLFWSITQLLDVLNLPLQDYSNNVLLNISLCHPNSSLAVNVIESLYFFIYSKT